MRTNRLKNISITIAILASVFIYAVFKSEVSKVTFLTSLDIIISNIIAELWKFVSTPTIFLGILAFILIWRFRNSIESIFPGLKEFKAGSFSALFEIPTDKDSSESINEKPRIKTDKNEEILDEKIAERTIGLLGKRTTRLFLDIDGKSFALKDLLNKLAESNLYESFLVSDDAKIREGFYAGIYRVMQTYVMRYLFVINLSEDGKIAHFKLKAGIREKIENRINQLENKP